MRLFELNKLTYFYPDSGSPESGRPALDSITLAINEGEFTIVTGPSGGGKTTLARILSGLAPRFFGGRIGGETLYRGRSLSDLDRGNLSAEIGIALQEPEPQIVTTRVEKELSCGPENLGYPPERTRRSLMEVAACLGLTGHLKARTDEISGGIAQRVVIGAVMSMGPRTLILDEPMSRLDPVAARDLLGTLAHLRDDLGFSVIVVEGNPHRSISAADRLIFLEDGRLCFDGSKQQFCRWAATSNPQFLPPVARLFMPEEENAIPLTVREGRAFLAAKPCPPATIPSPEANGTGERIASLKKISFTYPNGTKALSGISLPVHRGEIVALLGPNGAGKSTILKLICGILAPTDGEIEITGREPASLRNTERASLLGYLSQNPGELLFNDTVSAEIGYTMRALGMDREAAVAKSLSLWELSELSGRNPRELSTGERQRVAIAAATASSPPLLVLDEPTQGQDAMCRELIGRQLSALAREGSSALVATQDIEFAAEFCHRVILLFNGEIIADGSARDVLENGTFYSPQVSRLFHSFARGVITLADAREAMRMREGVAR